MPGPPKRFAQTVGLVLTLAATGFLVAGLPVVTAGLLAVLLVFALLESVVGFCAGCWVFAQLMKVGLVPEETCAACADISLRHARDRRRLTGQMCWSSPRSSPPEQPRRPVASEHIWLGSPAASKPRIVLGKFIAPRCSLLASNFGCSLWRASNSGVVRCSVVRDRASAVLLAAPPQPRVSTLTLAPVCILLTRASTMDT